MSLASDSQLHTFGDSDSPWLGWLLGVLGLSLIVDLPVKVGALTLYHTELALAVVLAICLPILWRSARGEVLGALAVCAPLLLWLALHGVVPGPPWEGVKAALRAGELLCGLWLPVLALRGRENLQRVTCFVFAGIVITSLWAVAETLAGPGSPLNAGHEIEVIRGFQAASAGFSHHNQMGAYLVASLALSAALVLAGNKRNWAIAAAILSVVALLCSYSRGAWLGAILVLAACGALLETKKRWQLLGLGLVALVLAWFLSPALQGRLAGLFYDSDRQVFRHALGVLGLGHEVWGWGVPALQEQLQVVAGSLPLGDEARRSFASHAHSFYLQQALAFGWPVLLFWAGAVGSLVQLAWRLAQVPSSRPYALAFLGAVAAFSLQSYTDVLTLHARGLAVSFIWGLLLAWGLSAGRKDAGA